MTPPRSNNNTQIAIANNNNTTNSCPVIDDNTKKAVQRNGIFSRFRRLRGGGRRVVQVPGDSKEGALSLDESITVDETDDEDSSFSFSSSENDGDIIDQLLSRKPVVVVLDDVEKVVDEKSALSSVTATTLQTQTVTKHVTRYDELGLSNGKDTHSSLSAKFSSSSSIHSCLKLLSSHDLDQNRLGLQRLILLTKGRTLSGSCSDSDSIRNSVSHILVFGGPFGSIEEQLRYIFATMICNSPHSDNHTHNHEYGYGNNNDYNDDDDDDDDYYGGDYFDDYRNEEEALFNWILDYNPNEVNLDSSNNSISNNDNNDNSDDSNDDNDNDNGNDNNDSSASYNSSSSLDQQHKKKKVSQQYPEGKASGSLHNHALRVLANALENVLSLSPLAQPTTALLLVDDDNSPIWKNIIHSLVNNIDRPHRNWNATGYSLKILRLLYEIMNNEDTAVTTNENNNNNNNNMILPLLRYSLFTQLVYLIEYGKSHHIPMIYKEASYLLRLCDKS